MIKYWLWIMLLVGNSNAQAQDIHQVVQQINPALYLNNMDNRPVYHQSVMDKNSLLFTRLYDGESERKEQHYHYCFLNQRKQTWVLEIRLDRHDFRVSSGHDMQAVRSSDFGINVYHLQGKQWKKATKQVLPSDFLIKFQHNFPSLQLSGLGFYYYNQDPECIILPNWKRKILHFELNGKKILCLAWRRTRFVWI